MTADQLFYLSHYWAAPNVLCRVLSEEDIRRARRAACESDLFEDPADAPAQSVDLPSGVELYSDLRGLRAAPLELEIEIGLRDFATRPGPRETDFFPLREPVDADPRRLLDPGRGYARSADGLSEMVRAVACEGSAPEEVRGLACFRRTLRGDVASLRARPSLASSAPHELVLALAIDAVHVAPQHRGYGYGSALIAAVFETVVADISTLIEQSGGADRPVRIAVELVGSADSYGAHWFLGELAAILPDAIDEVAWPDAHRTDPCIRLVDSVDWVMDADRVAP